MVSDPGADHLDCVGVFNDLVAGIGITVHIGMGDPLDQVMKKRVREDDVFGAPHQQRWNVLQLVESSSYPGEGSEGLVCLLDRDVLDEVANTGT